MGGKGIVLMAVADVSCTAAATLASALSGCKHSMAMLFHQGEPPCQRSAVWAGAVSTPFELYSQLVRQMGVFSRRSFS